MPGRVYIRSKTFPRKPGPWGALPFFATETNHISVDVTTGQRDREAPGRVAFSPMHINPSRPYHAPNGVTYACYEHYWQELKHFPDRDREKAKKFWRRRGIKKANRKLPKVVPSTCLYSADETRFPGKTFQYVASRKTFYVNDYRRKIVECKLAQAMLTDLRNVLNAGKHVVIADYDGPRSDEGAPLCEEVTVELLHDKLHDTRHPFGHGYLVAAEILGIEPATYSDA